MAEYINLPLQIQFALASGYAAYLLSFTGIRAHHTPVDTTFISLLFGLIASGTMLFLPIISTSLTLPVSAPVGFVVCCSAGVFWRLKGRRWLAKGLQIYNISWSDDFPTALASIHADSSHVLTQIAVLLEDGTWLECEDAGRFDSSLFGPCCLGLNGDIALYVTRITEKDRDPKEQDTVIDDEGDRVTYVPASKIKYMTIRQKR